MILNHQLWIRIQICYFLSYFTIKTSKGAVAPPAWANPKYNPCAAQPGGWQLLFWPPDSRCYKIFQIGYPCPDGMELSPVAISAATGEKRVAAECRCPPKTAQYAKNGQCYELFTIGPCDVGQYFAPDTQYISNSQNKRHWGVCKQIQKCSSDNEIFWPKDNQCYLYLTRGPCPKGQLITVNPDKIPTCTCNHRYEMRTYWSNGNGCYEHFTKGPCKENGHLFLPNQTCGCHNLLPHYHNKTQMCYEIGSIGPCNSGEQFQHDSKIKKASCQCKNGYIRYKKDFNCYRPYTQGPCELGFILLNTTTCIKQPCERGHLYYPSDSKCYRIGTKGPCSDNQVITFDFETRPSIDGISYNGRCYCRKANSENLSCLETEQTLCSKDRNVVQYQNQCFKLYSQGPCPMGAWLTIKRQSKPSMWDESTSNEAVCECMPGYKETRIFKNDTNVTECLPPTVILAEFLKNNYYALSTRIR